MNTLLFVYGTVLGSFFNVVGMRWIKGENICGRSECCSCKTQLKVKNLVPIFSWIFQKGKCSNCGERISAVYPVVELLTGIGFVLVYAVHGTSIETVIGLIYLSALIISGVTDYQTGYVLDKVTFPATALILVLSAFVPGRLYTHFIPAIITAVLLFIAARMTYLGEGDILPIMGVFLVHGILYAPVVMLTTSVLTLVYMVIKKTREARFIPFWVIGNIITYGYILLWR